MRISLQDIAFIRYSPHTSNDIITAQVVECYRQVFADSPWNEWLKCPKCHKYWGVKDAPLLATWNLCHCHKALVEFWPSEKVRNDLYHEITQDASCWLAIENNSKVVGFCWGYGIEMSELQKKIKIPFEATGQTLVAYQDELGVLPAYRNRKIAKSLVNHRNEDFRKQGLNYGIVRTRENPEPSQTFLWYRNIGYRILARYPDGRVLMGRELSGMWDMLNSNQSHY